MVNATLTSVQLTGTSEAKLNSDLHQFRPDKRYQLLAYLAYQGDWVSRDRLAYLFWPDVSPDKARNNLRQLLRRARALAFGAELEVESRRLRWAVETDVVAFVRATDEGRWQDALERYSGPLLAGLEDEDSGEFAAWLDLERERLHSRWRTAVLQRSEELERAGRHLESAELLKALIDGDELDEVALRAYVGALFRAGGRDRALRAYEAFVLRLREELGLEPTAELERLGQALRSGGSHEAPAQPRSSLTDATPQELIPALPVAIASFVGRDLELAEIARLLSRSDCRLLTLIGPGGIGKTRLALEAVQRFRPSYPDGVCFVPLEALAASALIPSSLADGLGMALQGQTDPLSQVIRFIGQRCMLLVLDNYEHLLDGATYALELVRACPGLSLLVTSRERLGLEAEWLLPIEGLGYPEETDLGPTEGLYFDAVQLFIERAQRVRPGFAPSREDVPHLLEICRVLEGSPLGLELAAVWVRRLPLSEIAGEIGSNLDFLGAAHPDRERRHHSLRSVFDQSWGRLTSAEQQALQRLSVFVGGFRAEAARHVANVPLPILAALADKSLLRLSPSGRYDRQDLLYRYMREKLAEHPDERTEAEERHGRYFLQFLAKRGDEIIGPEGKAALGALDEELENIRAAWRWAVDRVRVEDIGQTVVQAAVFYDRRARFHEGFAAFAALTAALGEDEPSHHLTLGDALVRQGWFAMRLGQYAEARALAERGFALLPAGSPSAMHGLNAVANIAERTGGYQVAEGRFKQAITLAKKYGFSTRQADFLIHLASVLAALGRYKEAESRVDQAMVLYERVLYPVGKVFGLVEQGNLALATGRLEEAEAFFRQGLSLARNLGVQQRVPSLLQGLAEVAHARGAFQEALLLGKEELTLTRAEGDRSMEAASLYIAARSSAALGADREALGQLQEGLSLVWPTGETPRLLEGLVCLAELRIKQGKADTAAPLLDLAMRHPATEHRFKALAARLTDQLRDQGFTAQTRGGLDRPLGLEALMLRVLAELELT
jgi:predicted ATPase/DNA-binding SARP family transcriptional activator